MIEIKRESINCEDAKLLIEELNQVLCKITGDDGTIHFHKEDLFEERSVFLIGYIDGIPYSCGALRELNQKEGEIKRIYSRKNKVGMASQLIHALEQYAIQFGYERLFLETRIQNIHAIEFYQKTGYIHCENFGVYQESENSYCFSKDL